MQIRESTEMYLKTIYLLSKKGNVRAIDVAKEMNFSRASISVTVHNLEKEKFLRISEDGFIMLEPKGEEIARRINERHTLISNLLMEIGVPAETAMDDACKIEHDISDQSFDCIKNFLKTNNKPELLPDEA